MPQRSAQAPVDEEDETSEIIMHRTAAPIAATVAASRPASRSCIVGQPTRPPATPAAGRAR